ncbi:MAG: hypothetical protein E7032_06420 [Akkermansiaceae bacterium]|nr:hypothetical protein [Akkermansiaceae bacterium]
MRKLLVLFSLVIGLSLLAPSPVFAKDEEDEEEDRRSRKEKTVPKSTLDRAFVTEITALTEAETMLKTISDAKSAKTVKAKLMHKFSLLRPLVGGTDAQLEELARAQNRVSAVMWELKKEPYFEEEKLQELWTVMTHHFARRSANLLK